METNDKKESKVQVDPTASPTENDTSRNEENIEKNSSSKITGNFTKKHGRTNNSFGDGHEPGTIPGSGV